VWPLACFERPLIDLWRERTDGRGADEREAYARRIAGRGESEVARLIAGAPSIVIDERSCYSVEPTAAGSFLGARHEVDKYLLAIDPMTKKVLDLNKTGARL
jgi:hypothetical protein